MGTRNITRVISGGVRRIEQYCQWDGEPTGHGLNVLAFSRELYKNGRVDELKDYLETTQLLNANQMDQKAFTYTCAPYNDSTDRIFHLVRSYENDHSGLYSTRAVDAMLNEGLLSMDEAKYYVTASRSR